MLRRLRKLALVHGERLVSLVLLLVFFLGTLPRIDCICLAGDGQAACPMHGSDGPHRCSTSPGQRSCCGESAVAAKRSCCQVTPPAESTSERDPPLACGGCCQRLIVTPDPATTASGSKIACQPDCDLAIDVVPLPVTFPADRIELGARLGVGPPPLDLVVVLQRFTI